MSRVNTRHPLHMLSRVAIRDSKYHPTPMALEKKTEQERDEDEQTTVERMLTSQIPFATATATSLPIARANAVNLYTPLPEEWCEQATQRLDKILKSMAGPPPFSDAKTCSAFLRSKKAILYGNFVRFCVQGTGSFHDVDVMMPEGVLYDEIDHVHYGFINDPSLAMKQASGITRVVKSAVFYAKNNSHFCVDVMNVQAFRGDLIQHVVTMADFDLLSLTYDGETWYQPYYLPLHTLSHKRLSYNISRMKLGFDLDSMFVRAQHLRMCGLDVPSEEEKFESITSMLPHFPADTTRFWAYLVRRNLHPQVMHFAKHRCTWPTPTVIAKGLYHAMNATVQQQQQL